MVGQGDEASAELLATIQREHVPTKTWYNTSPIAEALRDKYGKSYPSMWREVLEWDGWRETRKMYLKAMDGVAVGPTGAAVDPVKKENMDGVAVGPIGAAVDPVKKENQDGTTVKQEDAAVPPNRKRRSRWASTPAAPPTTDSTEPKKRKSRWARGRDETPQPINGSVPLPGLLASNGNLGSNGMPTKTVLDLLPGLPTNLNPDQMKELGDLQKKLREANEKLVNLEAKAAKIDALPVGHTDRSPSPPPVYGADGKRRNTRAIRWRERYTSQRQDTLEQILSLTTLSSHQNPNAVAPSLFRRKRTRKIPIPIEEHPTYNFIGLIIGPRGKTQKEMENKTGCKIAIRGKGSVKEGARGRRDGKMMDGDDEPLHVVVTGDNQGSVDAAADMVQQMLVVIDDDKNVHKQQQLRELALLNGTLKEEEFCQLCAEKGHRAFECPKRFAGNNKFVSVKCAICGDTSHPTRDCAQKGEDGVPLGTGLEGEVGVKDEKQMDKDYLAFMNEVDGKPAPAPGVYTPSTPAVVTLKSGGPVSETNVAIKAEGGVTICQPTYTSVTNSNAMPSSSSASVITTISSRLVPKAELEASAAEAPTATTSTTQQPPNLMVPPPAGTSPNMAPPTLTAPMAGAGIPPPPTTTPLPPGTAPASNLTGVMGGLPLHTHPPVNILPPPHSTTAYGQHQQQSYQLPQQQYQQQPPYGGGAYGGYQQTMESGYPPPPPQQQPMGYDTGGGYGAQQPPPMQPPPQQQQQQPPSQQQGGWDYRSYYGASGGNGNDTTDGAGGFNWWEA